uniref:Uncharacterized protein n=1 Tax=Lactuca sativa TaxID=4236 RepID=A0A9R1VCG9_LACSA|nr:hypothetical protein LSAT_V11C500251830 [Lactuca sativa]
MLEFVATFDLTQDSALLDLDDDFFCMRPDANKVKLVITYNKKGVVGKEATKLYSFEGLVARTVVLITYSSWLEVGAGTMEE